MVGDFFKTLAPHAIDSTAGTGLLPSVALAQAALESAYGKSELAYIHNNLFGIKAVKGQNAVTMRTREVSKTGQPYYINAPFRVFESPKQSFDERVKFFKKYPRYKPVLAATTPLEQAYALGRSGYATDPTYGNKILSIINSYKLTQYDAIAKKKLLPAAPAAPPQPFARLYSLPISTVETQPA
jgi:flagellum-specific peptidoglycan hydrolase FlgJ